MTLSRAARESLEAVALEYGQNKTPVVVAKGRGELAQLIVEEAEKQGVYVTRDPQLLGLLSALEVDQEIPENLYTAVAIILSWAYWLKGMRPGDEQLGGTADSASDSAAGGAGTGPTRQA